MHCLKCGSPNLNQFSDGSISCGNCGYKQSIGTSTDDFMNKDQKFPKLPEISKNKIFER